MSSDGMRSDMNLITEFFDSRDIAVCDDMQSWLEDDPKHVSLFVDHMLLHNDLGRLVLADDLTRYDLAGNGPRPTGSAQIEPRPSSRSKFPWSSMVLAASLLVTIAALFFASGHGVEQAETEGDAGASLAQQEANYASSTPAEDLQSETVSFAATVSDTENCQWKNIAAALSPGQYLKPGAKVALVRGLAQLTFETGAAVVIEGPCELVVKENAIDLLLGKLSATVPRNASGFAVDTPNSQVVDLGTEFGINVESDGGTEIHVFKGEVISRRTDDLGEPISKFVRLTTNNAIAFRQGTKEAEQFEANEAAFVRILRKAAIEDTAEAAPVEGSLLLWLAADRGLLKDANGGVLAWLDTLTPSFNRIADNALQAAEDSRPQFVPRAFGEMPALRFDGQNDFLTTTPMSTGDSQTIAFVATIDGQGAKEKGNLINYNGPPQMVGVDGIRGKVSILQIRACEMLEDRVPLLDPFVYAGHWQGERLFAGRMEQESRAQVLEKCSPALGEPFVGVYVYDMLDNRAELFVNGESYGRSTAPVPASIVSRKVIGRHGHWPDYFAGQIAELLIYDEGLNDERIRRLTSQLSQKYGISTN